MFFRKISMAVSVIILSAGLAACGTGTARPAQEVNASNPADASRAEMTRESESPADASRAETTRENVPPSDASSSGTAQDDAALEDTSRVDTSADVTDGRQDAPEKHTITADPSLSTLDGWKGADAFYGSLDHTDTVYYVINDYYNMKSEGGRHILSNFATYQQTTEYSCGCAAALMVLNYYGINDYNELEICDIAQTDRFKGTSVEGLVKFFKQAGFEPEYHADIEARFGLINEFETYVIEKIDSGTPIMVNWVDWQGHWQVIIGIDTCGNADPYDDVLIMADPYDVTDHYQDGYYVFPLGRFFEMWREGPCVQKGIPYEQPYVVAYKDR